MPEYPPEELPAHDKLADASDVLDWNVARDGRMVEYATEAEPATIPWEG